METLSIGAAMQKIVLNSVQAIARAANLVAQLKPEQLMQIEITEWKPPRTLSANALYWVWMQHLGKHLGTQQKTYCKDAMHDVCRHKFLGYKSNGKRFIDGTQMPPQLRSTSKLTKAEMCFYMSQLDAWAVTLGCLLPSPDDSEYHKFKRKQIE